MSKARTTTQHAVVFAALGHSTRLDLVRRLGDGNAHAISDLTDGLDLTRQGITKHLAVLEDAGLVASKRVGRERRFTIQPTAMASAGRYLARASAQYDEALRRLRAHVED